MAKKKTQKDKNFKLGIGFVLLSLGLALYAWAGDKLGLATRREALVILYSLGVVYVVLALLISLQFIWRDVISNFFK